MNDPATYPYGENLYLNLTSLCPTECAFCIKHASGRRFRGHDLALEREPEVDEVWDAVLARTASRLFAEFVFCGYGESTYRLDALLEVSARLKRHYPRSARRLNTVGLGGLIWERDIVPDLSRAVTSVNISLNTAEPEQWRTLMRPRPEFRDRGFDSVLGFIRACVLADLRTTVTAVDLPGVDLPAVARLAESLGAAFLARPRLSRFVAT